MTREEHLQWAKERALKEPEISSMWGSFNSDMSKHEELVSHIALPLGMMLFTSGSWENISDCEKFIEGFN